MFETTFRPSRQVLARLTGGAYVAFMGASVLANGVSHIGLGNAPQIVGSMTGDAWGFRLGLLSALVSQLLFLLAAWGLYVLLRPVSRDLALLFLLLNAIGVAIQSASLLQLVPGMVLTAGGESSLQASLALVGAETFRTGFAISQLFFGVWLFPLGYLVLTSGFLPRLLGALLILDGVCELVWFCQALLVPDHPEIRMPGTLVSLVAEVGLALWLLFRGVAVRSHASDPVSTTSNLGIRL